MAEDYEYGGAENGSGPYGGSSFGGLAPIPAPEQTYIVEAIDHVQKGLQRVLKQYQNSPNFLAFLSAPLSLSNQIEAVLQSMFYMSDPDLMVGAQLDLIGRIVGQTRNILDAVELPFFGFQDTPNAKGFGEIGLPQYGAPFAEYGQIQTESTVFGDAQYRILIRCRIIKNHSNATPENIMDSLAYLFGTTSVNTVEAAPMHMTLVVRRNLTPTEQAIFTQLDILPRPAGVQLDGLITYDINNFFGFADQLNAKGFGELSDASVGGVFAELI